MPSKHHPARRESSHPSTARNTSGIQLIADRLSSGPTCTRRKYGAQNMASAAATHAASGATPRRSAHRYMNAPSSQKSSAMLQFSASGSGSTSASQFGGYSSADWIPPKNGAPP